MVNDPLIRNIAALAAAIFVVGGSFGAIAASAGVSAPHTIAMSLLVFAGGAQFLAVGIVGAGGSAVAAVLAGLLLNARLLPFGLALGDVAGSRPLHRLVGAHLLIDESVAFALAQPDLAKRRRAFWISGLTLFVVWNTGAALGVLAGQAAGDPAVFGIDAAFPAGLLALVMPTLGERPATRVAVVAGTAALVTAPLLPPGLPVLIALIGVAAAVPAPARWGRQRRPLRPHPAELEEATR
jgi:4-azaleucine resistance transporter AzlC